MRPAEPIPGLADAPEIAIVVFAAGEKKIPAVRGPLTGGLRSRLPPARENRMQTGAIRGHFPDPFGAILALVHTETKRFAGRGPDWTVTEPGAMPQFCELAPH